MPVENVEEIKTYLEANKDDEGVKTFVSTLNPVTAIKTAEEAKAFIETVPLLKSHLDSHANHESEERVKNYKTTYKDSDEYKQMKAAIIKEANPNETPEQKTIRELQERLDKYDKDSEFRTKIDAAVSKAPENLKEVTRNLLKADIETLPELLIGMTAKLEADNVKLIADGVEAEVKNRMANVKPLGSNILRTPPPKEKAYKDYTQSEKTDLYRNDPEKFKELDPVMFATLVKNRR